MIRNMGRMRRTVRGVIFDMDGTLTKPILDFKKMRNQVSVALGRDIGRGDMLEEIKRESSEELREAALKAIHEVELEGLLKLQLADGVMPICNFLDEHKVPRAILTRNSKMSLDYFHQKLPEIPEFSPAVSRDCGFKPKPYPDALQHICNNLWGIPTHEVIMIGDSAKDDILAGRRAGAITVLLGEEAERTNIPEEQEPDFRIRDLMHFHSLLQNELEVVGEGLADVMG